MNTVTLPTTVRAQPNIRPLDKRWLRFLLALLTVGFLTIALTQPAHAAEFRSGDTAVIGADEVIDDDIQP